MRGIALAAILFLFFACEQKKSNEPARTPDTVVVRNEPSQPTSRQTIPPPFPVVDISPMDMSYYPADYPKLKMAKTADGPPMARVVYSRPQLQGRNLFSGILKYGEPWRLGANEATELHLFRDASIN